jgi:hypothetical protein
MIIIYTPFSSLKMENMLKRNTDVTALGLHTALLNFKSKFREKVHNASKCKTTFSSLIKIKSDVMNI